MTAANGFLSSRYLAPLAGKVGIWNALGAAGAVAVVYFLAARLGLALLDQSSDVAVFWPASGIAAGILLLSGRRASPALVLGIVIGTVAANLMSDRSLSTSILKGICNAGEPVLMASLLLRWFGRPFTFGELRCALLFLAAAGLATAASAVGGAATMVFLHTTAPFWDVWRAWFLSDVVGIVVVTPLMIGIGQLWRKLPTKSELMEGAGVLALLALSAIYIVTHPTGSWMSFSPGALVLPLLLWLAARCPPPFAIAGAFIASIAVIFATTFGIGRFGDATVSIMERVKGAQVAVLSVTAYTLVLTALFTDRKRAAVHLSERDALLDLGGKVARIGRFVYDHATRKLQLSPGCAAIYGLPEDTIEISREDWRARVHPDDLPRLDAIARRAFSNGQSEFVLEFRILRDGEVRWIESRVLILYNEAGKPVRRIGAKIDVTERKQAEQALAERNTQLTLAAKAGLVGTYAYDVDAQIMQISAGYVAIHGFAEGTTKIARSECLAGVHPDDVGTVERSRSDAFRDRLREYRVEYRIIRPGGELRWVETRCFISFSGEGHPHRVVGVSIDITERKQAEDQQRTLLAELDHRVKNALATVGAVVSHTGQGSLSVADFVAALEGRLRSMASAHELLSARGWHGVSLTELVRRELAPYATPRNIKIDGPDVILRAEAAPAMAMVLHELAINAAKYGALSTRDGRVSIRWDRPLNGHLPHLVLEWREIGGPPVVAPSKSGYGMSTIRDLIPYEFGGTVDLVFPPEGVRCRLKLPADWLGSNRQPETTADASLRRGET